MSDPLSGLRELRRWVQGRLLADSEAASEAQGFLSWRGETHALLTVGLPVGFLLVLTGRLELLALVAGWALRGGGSELPLRLPYRRQLLKEAGYLLGGLAGGAIAAIGARAIVTALPAIA